MNKGVEILLERMKSNPEEFEYRIDLDADRWTILFRDYESVLEPEDVEAYKSARRKMLQDKFTADVMKELLDPKPLANPYLVQPSATRLGGATQGQFTINNIGAVTGTTGTVTLPAGSITLGKTQLQEEQVKHMLAHLDWLKREEQLKEKEKPKTIFGKLFNYT
jgi:hypothetical protein